MYLNNGIDVVDVQWDHHIIPEMVGTVSVAYDPSWNDDSWVTIWTPNNNPTVMAEVSMGLEGLGRPVPAGWQVPVTIKFFMPGADVLNASPLYSFAGTTGYDSSRAKFQCTGLAQRYYDITVVSGHTLTNVKRNVYIGGTITSVDMGTLLEGNCNNDNAVNGLDFLILKNSWLKSSGQPGFDARADFDRNGTVNGLDFLLLKTNWLKSSPIQI